MKRPGLLLMFLFFAVITSCSDKINQNEIEGIISGIDVSLHQGDINFELVKKDGIDYVFIRATDGVTYQDQNFQQNYKNAKTAGMVVGAYHFYRNQDDPLDQLHNFINIAHLETGDLAPVVDIEQFHQAKGRNFNDDLSSFLKELEKHYQIKPIIYSGKNFANEHLLKFSKYPLWHAQYETDAPEVPKGWTNWTFWQWSETGRVNGINKAVDMTRFNKEDFSFQDYLINNG